MTKGSASAVDKALDLLEAIARSTTPMKLSELAEEVGMLRPTAHRVLGELANRGWVFRYDGRYLPGPAALQVSHEAAAHSLAALCDPTMRVLSEHGHDGESAGSRAAGRGSSRRCVPSDSR
ncbi:helix-turn-helix domain-containing protein [Rhodococcus sp. 3Y1]